jgi:hypothetical protein
MTKKNVGKSEDPIIKIQLMRNKDFIANRSWLLLSQVGERDLNFETQDFSPLCKIPGD